MDISVAIVLSSTGQAGRWDRQGRLIVASLDNYGGLYYCRSNTKGLALKSWMPTRSMDGYNDWMPIAPLCQKNLKIVKS